MILVSSEFFLWNEVFMLSFLAGNCAFIPEVAGLWLWIAAVVIVCVMSVGLPVG